VRPASKLGKLVNARKPLIANLSPFDAALPPNPSNLSCSCTAEPGEGAIAVELDLVQPVRIGEGATTGAGEHGGGDGDAHEQSPNR
jgi:hypothetical protein